MEEGERARFIYIKLDGVGCFAKLDIMEGDTDTISSLAERACVKFLSWGVSAEQISLYLAAAGGEDTPTDEAIIAALSVENNGVLSGSWSLTRAGVSSGAWLVAKKNKVDDLLLSAIGQAAVSALQTTYGWLTAMGSCHFSAALAAECAGVPTSRGSAALEPCGKGVGKEE